MSNVKELYQHLVNETKKFFESTGFNKAVIGLSGGIDSALVATITCDALGPGNVLGICMPSKYSSGGSLIDSKSLAINLRIKCVEVPINDIYDKIWTMLIDSMNIGFWSGSYCDDFFIQHNKEVSITEQNIQARVRMIILYAFANKYNMLVMNTCNLTEDQLGYATMYGDGAGAISPLGNIGKLMVYELAEERNTKRGFPIPENILTKAPSAELAPGQTDEGSLKYPYSILDPLTRLIRFQEKMGTIVDSSLSAKFGEKAIEDVKKLMKDNAFKLKQSPPAIDVSSYYE